MDVSNSDSVLRFQRAEVEEVGHPGGHIREIETALRPLGLTSGVDERDETGRIKIRKPAQVEPHFHRTVPDHSLDEVSELGCRANVEVACEEQDEIVVFVLGMIDDQFPVGIIH